MTRKFRKCFINESKRRDAFAFHFTVQCHAIPAITFCSLLGITFLQHGFITIDVTRQAAVNSFHYRIEVSKLTTCCKKIFFRKTERLLLMSVANTRQELCGVSWNAYNIFEPCTVKDENGKARHRILTSSAAEHLARKIVTRFRRINGVTTQPSPLEDAFSAEDLIEYLSEKQATMLLDAATGNCAHPTPQLSSTS